ncbi:MAG: metallophosphoesterase [Ruminococcaceae bacterium]|nr:metallophosphoesterase [Oscillospiraceae bacterium]
MKILVLSDSHSTLRIMRSAVSHIKPDAIIHLGDFFDDGEVIRKENTHIRFYQVPGNCDRHRMYPAHPENLCMSVCGVKLFMTHGHNHFVKSSLYYLLEDAKAAGVQAAVFGHTHSPLCEKRDGIWILNPGSCGNGCGTVGLMTVDCGEILNCRILRAEDWEESV